MRGNAAEDVFWRRLRVLHLDVEIVPLVEDARVRQLVLELMPRPGPVHRHEVAVRELALRVLVQVALVTMRRKVIDVEVILLDVLTVVAFGVRQAEQALFQDGVPFVPQREGQAQPLLVVADPGQAVLTPPVGAGPRLIMAEIRPGISAVAVVLANRPPLALAQVRSPGPPADPLAGLPQPPLFGGQTRGIEHPSLVTAPLAGHAPIIA